MITNLTLKPPISRVSLLTGASILSSISWFDKGAPVPSVTLRDDVFSGVFLELWQPTVLRGILSPQYNRSIPRVSMLQYREHRAATTATALACAQLLLVYQ
eukprot:2881-Heterococcus_DN1.PRE.2